MTQRGFAAHRSRPLRLTARAVAALSGILTLALILSGLFWAPKRTDAAWTEADQTTGTFQALTLGPAADLKCEDSRINLLGLGNDQEKLSWGHPAGTDPDAPVQYRVTAVEGLLGGTSTTYEVSDNSLVYTAQESTLLGLTVNFTVRPFIEDWEGESVSTSALAVTTLGLGLSLTCDILGLQASPTLDSDREDDSAGTATDAVENVPPLGSDTTTPTLSDPEDADEATSSSPRTSASLSTTVPTLPSRTSTTVPPSATTPHSSPAGTSLTSTPPTSAMTTPPSTVPPEIVIPRDPGTLRDAARTEDVATVTVGDEDLDVVVVGNTAPTDARAGARALQTWLGDDTRPTGDWATFTSTDPDEDGWRWAAINQTTGTVVYIR